jgi:hypothetical protein
MPDLQKEIEYWSVSTMTRAELCMHIAEMTRLSRELMGEIGRMEAEGARLEEELKRMQAALRHADAEVDARIQNQSELN